MAVERVGVIEAVAVADAGAAAAAVAVAVAVAVADAGAAARVAVICDRSSCSGCFLIKESKTQKT